MKNYLVFAFVLLCFSACVTTQWEHKEFEGGISLEVPDYMKEVQVRNNELVLQLENVNRELYFVLDVQSKSGVDSAGVKFDLRAFSQSLMRSMAGDLKKAQVEERGLLKCGDLDAFAFTVSGKPQIAQSISYQVMVVEDEEVYYLLTAWTTSGAKTNWYKEDLRRMMESFRVLN